MSRETWEGSDREAQARATSTAAAPPNHGALHSPCAASGAAPTGQSVGAGHVPPPHPVHQAGAAPEAPTSRPGMPQDPPAAPPPEVEEEAPDEPDSPEDGEIVEE